MLTTCAMVGALVLVGRGGTAPQGEGLYGRPAAMPREAVRRARPMASGESAWRRAPFFCVATELSPMTLYGCQANSLTCFAGLGEQGLGAPTYVAWATR